MKLSSKEIKKRIKAIHADKVVLLSNYISMNHKHEFRCNNGHTWHTRIANVIHLKSGCKECYHTITKPKQRTKTHKQYVSEVNKKHNGDIKVVGTYIKAKLKIKHQCLSCNTSFMSRPSDVLTTEFGCENCSYIVRSDERRLGSKVIKQRTHKRHGNKYKWLEDPEYANEKYLIRCNTCKHEWRTLPHTIYHKQKGKGCPVCFLYTHDFAQRGRKEFILAGNKVFIQGFEDRAIRYLTKEKGIPEKQIKVGKDIPRLKVDFNGRVIIHSPDIWIPKQNRLVEVKSIWTFGLTRGRLEWFKLSKAKRKAAIEQGFKYNLLLMESNGNRLVLPENWHTMKRKEVKQYLEREYNYEF